MMEKIGIVVSQFNWELTGEMLKKSIERARDVGFKIVTTIEVPGTYEIPLAVQELLKDKNIDGVATLGTIIKGGTDHDVIIAHSVAKALLDLQIQYKKPVSLGISGPNITWQQSEKRIEEYAFRAIDTLAKVLRR